CIGWQSVGVEFRKWRLLLWWPHIGEDEAIAFEGRIRTLAHCFFQTGSIGLTRCIKQRPVHVVMPAVVTAADAVLGNDAVFQRGAAVRALSMHDADIATPIAKCDQVLAHDSDCLGYVSQFLRQAHRLPESAHVLA